VFFIIFPILSVLLNNLFLFIIGYKNWKEWLKISQKFYKIFYNIEIGFMFISLISVGIPIGIYRKEFAFFINNISNILKINKYIILTIFVILFCIIIILLMELLKKIFIKKE
jgi:hypothetical protein